MYNNNTSRYSIVKDGDVCVYKHFIIKHEDSEIVNE